MSRVVDQGGREGVFTTRHPDQIGRVTMGLLFDLNEAVLELLMVSRTRNVDGLAVEQTFAAYTDALERVLGAREGSLVLADPAILKLWFESSDEAPHLSASEEKQDGGLH